MQAAGCKPVFCSSGCVQILLANFKQNQSTLLDLKAPETEQPESSKALNPVASVGFGQTQTCTRWSLPGLRETSPADAVPALILSK